MQRACLNYKRLLLLHLNLSFFHNYFIDKVLKSKVCFFFSPELHCRYLESCGNALDDENAQKKLEPTALSCILNTAACKLKLQLWQEAVESCDEVRKLTEGTL